jgi:hypothetical protein
MALAAHPKMSAEFFLATAYTEGGPFVPKSVSAIVFKTVSIFSRI